MKIKDRLSLYFALVSSTILLIVMVAIYLSFYKLLQIDFFNRLKSRINVATRLYIEADEQSRSALSDIKEKFQEKVPGEIIRIYDNSNKPVFIPDDKYSWPDSIINQVRKSEAIQYSDRGRYIMGMHYKAVQGDFVILISATDPDRIIQLSRFRIIMVFIFVFSIIIVFIVGRIFSQKALSPINKLIGQLQTINANSLNIRIKAPQENDEIGLLAKDFNQLLIKLENSFELQKAFVANISHELRTPITSMIGEAEVSLKHERTTEEYRAVIESILTDSERLNDTISGLIDLAQVDVHFKQVSSSPLRIDDLIWELQEFWSKKLYPNALQVRMDHVQNDESFLIINANKTLLTIAINNVINNAFKFSKNSPVSCSLETREGLVKIKVQDTGIGIRQEELKKIFEAFYRTDQSSTYPGSGIGLYVTHKIIQLLNGKIELYSVPDLGTTAEITFVIWREKETLT